MNLISYKYYYWTCNRHGHLNITYLNKNDVLKGLLNHFNGCWTPCTLEEGTFTYTDNTTGH